MKYIIPIKNCDLSLFKAVISNNKKSRNHVLVLRRLFNFLGRDPMFAAYIVPTVFLSSSRWPGHWSRSGSRPLPRGCHSNWLQFSMEIFNQNNAPTSYMLFLAFLAKMLISVRII